MTNSNINCNSICGEQRCEQIKLLKLMADKCKDEVEFQDYMTQIKIHANGCHAIASEIIKKQEDNLK